MKDFFKPIREDHITIRCFSASWLLLLGIAVYTLIVFVKLPPLVPIFTQLPWGGARIAKTAFIFLPIFLCFLFLLLNMVISARLYKHAPLLSRMLAITSFFTSFLAAVFCVRTILLVL